MTLYASISNNLQIFHHSSLKICQIWILLKVKSRDFKFKLFKSCGECIHSHNPLYTEINRTSLICTSRLTCLISDLIYMKEVLMYVRARMRFFGLLVVQETWIMTICEQFFLFSSITSIRKYGKICANNNPCIAQFLHQQFVPHLLGRNLFKYIQLISTL